MRGEEDQWTENDENETEEANVEESELAEVTCRICHGGAAEGRLFRPCLCKGTCAFVHVKCLERWRTSSTNPRSFYRCEACLFEYKLR